MKKELLKGLTEEQIAKVKECKNQEELLKLAKAEGIELNDEQLAAISGGACSGEDKDDKKDKGPTNNPF
jgi:bacteriocin-like protein